MRRFRVVLLLAFLVAVTLLLRAPRSRPAAPRASRPVPAEAVAVELPPPPAAPDPLPLPDAEAPAPESDMEATLPVGLRWLLAHQNVDGSWGDARIALEGVEIDRPGLTGLALAALVGAGFSHLSKEVYDGRCVGVALRGGLDWLMCELDVDGLPRSARRGLDPPLAAFALSEAYGMTGSILFRDQAQRAFDGLARLQAADGSWGSGPATAWATEALLAARLAGLVVSTTPQGVLLAYYDRRRSPDAAEVVARIQFERQRFHPALPEAVGRILRDASEPSLHALYFNSRALFQYDGPAGAAWRDWSPRLKEAVRTFVPQTDRSLSEQTLQAALIELCMEVYYTRTVVSTWK